MVLYESALRMLAILTLLQVANIDRVVRDDLFVAQECQEELINLVFHPFGSCVRLRQQEAMVE
jgi:hypothetical protein